MQKTHLYFLIPHYTFYQIHFYDQYDIINDSKDSEHYQMLVIFLFLHTYTEKNKKWWGWAGGKKNVFKLRNGFRLLILFIANNIIK